MDRVVSQEISVGKAVVMEQQLYQNTTLSPDITSLKKIRHSDITVHHRFQLLLLLTILNYLFSFLSPLDICE